MQKVHVIAVVDDDDSFRRATTSFVRSLGYTALQFASAEAFLKSDRLHDTDCLISDVQMPGMNGVDTLGALAKTGSSSRVIILTSFETDEDIYRAFQAGAQGYLLKNTSLREMVEAITMVHAGRRYVPGHIASRLAERMMRTNLTVRELEILKMLAKGPTNKEIAQALGISDNTVRNHVNSIIEKLEVSDRTEAATTAIQRGLITVDD